MHCCYLKFEKEKKKRIRSYSIRCFWGKLICLIVFSFLLFACSFQASFYVLFLTVLSYALICGSTQDDPTQYSGKANGLRLFCEILSVTFLVFYLFKEIDQAERWVGTKWYWIDYFHPGDKAATVVPQTKENNCTVFFCIKIALNSLRARSLLFVGTRIAFVTSGKNQE